jgi:hypothetical protein
MTVTCECLVPVAFGLRLQPVIYSSQSEQELALYFKIKERQIISSSSVEM